MTYLFPLIEGGRGEVLKVNSVVGGGFENQYWGRGEGLKINRGG